MAATTNQMEQTTEDLNHNSTLKLALDYMLENEDTQTVVPPTTSLVGGAKKFAEAATAKELMEYVYMQMTEIENTVPDATVARVCPATTAAPAACADNDRVYPDQYVEAFNHKKYIRLMALSAIAACTPQAVVDQIVNTQIKTGGRYEDTAYQFLMLRVVFIGDFFLNERSFNFPTGLDNLDKLEEAYDDLNRIQSVANLPFTSLIKIQTQGIIDAKGVPAASGTPGSANGNYSEHMAGSNRVQFCGKNLHAKFTVMFQIS